MLFWADNQTTDVGWFKLQNDGNGNISNLTNFQNAIDSVSRANKKLLLMVLLLTQVVELMLN